LGTTDLYEKMLTQPYAKAQTYELKVFKVKTSNLLKKTSGFSLKDQTTYLLHESSPAGTI